MPNATTSPQRRFAARVKALLPAGGTLPDDVWRSRHRGILTLLWLHVPGIMVFALLRGVAPDHALLEALMVAVPASLALIVRDHRRVSTIATSVGLMTASAVIVHLSGGVIEAHFHFFVMVGVVVLYQDWAPFLIAIGFVIVHHGTIGMLVPHDVYNHGAAVDAPWKWALVHGTFIAAMSATGIATWRLNESLQRATLDREQKLAEAQQLARMGSWEWDIVKGRILWSDEQYRLFGLAPQSIEPTYEHFLSMLHPDDRPVLNRMLERAWQQGEPTDIEFRVVLADGSMRWIHGRGDISGWDGERVTSMHGTCQDITETKRAEESRRETEERYKRIVETTQDGVWTFDASYRTTFVNARMAELLGYPPSEMVGKTLFGFITQWGDALAPAPVTAPSNSPAQYDCKLLRKDGSELWALLSISWMARDGEPAGLATVNDITSRKLAEQALAQARDEALDASRRKSQFLANTSHEIRTPLTVVLGMNELLLETGLDDTQRRFAESVQRAGTSLLSIVSDILDFSKIEAGKLELEIGRFDLHLLSSEVVALLGDSAAPKGLEVVHSVDPGVPRWVQGDGGRLRQILLNLVSNAVKFTEEGKVGLTVGPAEAHRHGVCFEVIDTGIGIAASDIRRLFQPFSQVDASTTRRFGGTGLGLAISKQLAEAMGGTIEVDSTPGLGSKFRLELPLAPAVPDLASIPA